MLSRSRRSCNWYFLLSVAILVAFRTTGADPIAEGADKFLGNIVSSSIPSDFGEYWNQITLENGGKWGSVESTRDQMNWAPVTMAYNYALQNGIPYKQHAFVWGNQAPGWINGLSTSEQRAEVEEWIREYGERYPETAIIDVVNEPLNAPPSFREALGGDGETGWDWVVTSFEMAREHCPDAQLWINEYEIEYDAELAVAYLEIIRILKERNLVDGVGLQCHTNEIQRDKPTIEAIIGALDTLASAGVPLYVSELDLKGDDATQLADYQRLFPVFWEHPAIHGVTLWGYHPPTWIEGTELISNGRVRPALTWLREYVAEHKTAVATQKIPEGTTASISASILANGTIGFSLPYACGVTLSVIDLRGRPVAVFREQPFSRGAHSVPLPHSAKVSGVSVIVLTGEGFRITQKVVARF